MKESYKITRSTATTNLSVIGSSAATRIIATRSFI